MATSAPSPTPRRSVARRGPQKKLSADDAKAKVLDLIASGSKVEDACRVVDRAPETYRDWMKTDPAFNRAVAQLRDARQSMSQSGAQALVPDFETFCREWLKQPLAVHQLRILDVLEGREPRDILPAFQFTPGIPWAAQVEGAPAGRFIINMPPGFAKTTTFSINYTTWLIHKNPDLRIIVVCKDQGLAKQILGAVKFRLTSPIYREMHMRFAPEGGWKDPDQSWTQTEIYVKGKGDGEKDPTMQALGIGGRIYGARSDIIILDDSVTLANVNEHEKQQRWLDQEVESRLDGAGMLAMFGTRVAPTDLYRVQREVTDWDDRPVYTYFSMPAIVDEGDGQVENWVSLWPERFPPERLRKMRRDERMWALVYQQQDVSEDATFNSFAVAVSINRSRKAGPMVAGAMGHREQGREGLYVVGGLDPASVGNTAFVVVGLDKTNINSHGQVFPKRYVLDGANVAGMQLGELQDTMKRLTEAHSINEWVIERNAAQLFLLQDRELNIWMRARGVRMSPHHTNVNKLDPDFGVMGMAPLFDTCGRPGKAGTAQWARNPFEDMAIELPDTQSMWVSQLVNQLTVWQPSGMKTGQKTDLVMALWFTEVAVQRVLGYGQAAKPKHRQSVWLTPGQKKQQTVVNLADLRQQKLAERQVV